MKMEATLAGNVRSASILLLLFAMLAPVVAMAQPNQEDEKPENLKVLPEDMSMQQVRRVMFGFTGAMGVNCLYCHVGEPGQPDTFDFASDEKEPKETARAMMRMVKAINDDHITQLPEGDDRIQVNCQTCHHGIAKPQLLEDILTNEFSENGVEEAIAEYNELKGEYYGGFSYNFQAGTLNSLAQRLISMQEPEAALQFLGINAEMYPEDASIFALMGEAHLAAGDRASAIENMEKSLSMNPRNRRLQERLDQVKAGN